MGFNGDLYPTAGATSVLSTKGDLIRYNTERERYGIGSAGQVLQVASSLPTWSTINLADSVLTTQGDVLYEGASALARLGQSTSNYTLATKGAGANPAWQPSATSVLTTTGDLLYASGANTLARLAGGTSGDVLTANGAGVAPSYQTAGGGAWTNLGSATEASATAEISLDVADHDLYMVYYNVSTDASSTNMYMSATINDITADYASIYSYSSGGAWASGYITSGTMFRIGGADLNDRAAVNCFGYIFLNKVLATSLSDSVTIRSIAGDSQGSGGGTTNFMETSLGVASSETDIDSIQLKIESGLIQGSFTVNAMDF